MDWLKKLKKSENSIPRPPDAAEVARDEPTVIRFDAFKSHWLQIYGVINPTSTKRSFISTKQSVQRNEIITADDVDTVRNLLEQMIFLLIEEQCSGQFPNPILDYAINQEIFENLYTWWESSSSFKEQILLNLLKVYEVMISQAQYSLLNHKQLVSPMLRLLSNNTGPKSEELDGHIVLLLNLLCVWMNRDPNLIEVFFNSQADHGPDQFLIFSLLIEYIHREGTVGQQARDALLLCSGLTFEHRAIADYIVQQSNFCPVLATGLSALYSTLPRHMDVRADDWHCLQKNDWSHVPELINFMNSFDFCNSVIEVSCDSVTEQLLDFFYNGFLVSVFGPSLHKTSADEVVVTTAYLNLFLRSVTAPALMRCFLRFLLTHRHESSLIINTLIQRIASSNRLALVSLSLIRTLVDMNCEDLLLQLVFRYLMPCQHILASQRRAICDVDLYNASASRFLALTPAACAADERADNDDEIFAPVTDDKKRDRKAENPSVEMKPLSSSNNASSDSDGNNPFHILSPPSPVHDLASIKPPFYRKSQNRGSSPINGVHHAYTINEDLSVTVNVHSASSSDLAEFENGLQSPTLASPSPLDEVGTDLQSRLELSTSYMDYLEDAKAVIAQCREACASWSATYDGVEPVDDEAATQNVDTSSTLEMEKTPITASPLPENGETAKPVENLATPPDALQTDALQTDASDTTMKALSATYQALNITALALSRNSANQTCLHKLDHKNSTEVTNGDSHKLPFADTTRPEFIEGDTRSELTQQTVAVDEETSNVSSHVRKTSLSDLETNLSPLSEHTPDTNRLLETSTNEVKETASDTTQGTNERTHRSSSTTTTSSVDEFFRGLMEIVPKTLAGKNKTVVETKVADEDVESGIELPSEGDALLSREEDESGLALMTQSSRNDAMNETEYPLTDVAKAHYETNAYGEAINSRTYSFADDTEEEEFDDSMSMTSSSFYEANDEYEPTDVSVGPSAPLKLQGVPYTGPLIGNLFAKLDQMINNSLYENLLLTGIVARLAAYPQPLLRSFLLNTHMVFHPSVRSLYQVLNSASNKIDAYASQVSDFKVLMRRAQKYLLARGTYPFSGDARTRNTIQNRPMPVPKVKTRTLGDMFKRKKPKDSAKKRSLIPSLETLLERHGRSNSSKDSGRDTREMRSGSDSGSMFYVRQRIQQKEERKLRELRTKNAVYACIVLAEFLKELAAIAQEHAVAQV